MSRKQSEPYQLNPSHLKNHLGVQQLYTLHNITIPLTPTNTNTQTQIMELSTIVKTPKNEANKRTSKWITINYIIKIKKKLKKKNLTNKIWNPTPPQIQNHSQKLCSNHLSTHP